MTDPFPQALYDFHFDDQTSSLRYRHGNETWDADIELYFQEYASSENTWLNSWLDGPLLDMGAGVGRHTLYFQNQFETVAIEHHESLVETMHDRGVKDPRCANMFALRDTFERDRFSSALAIGTQVSLSRSMQGLRQFLGDLAYITTSDATAVIDGFDPDHEQTMEKRGYYDDPTEGLAHRIIQFEYDGTLGEPWLYRLFTPDRIREATVGTGWEVAEVKYGSDGWAHNYKIALRKP